MKATDQTPHQRGAPASTALDNKKPIPTKFHPNDSAWVRLLCRRSGLKGSEVIRRAVRVLAAESQLRPKWNWIADTAQPLPMLSREQWEELGGEPPSSFDEANQRAKATADADRKRHPRRARS